MNNNHPKLEDVVIHFWKIIIHHNIYPKLDCTGHPF